jgi:hypothetical protein
MNKYLKFSLIFLCFFSSCESIIELDAKKITKKGIVIGKYKDQIGCHGSIVVRSDGQIIDSLIGLCYCVPRQSQEIWKYVEVGDSLVKKSGDLEITIYRNGNIKIFEYPICIQ